MCSGAKGCLFWSEEESMCACLCVNSCLSVYVSKSDAASFPNLTSCVTMPLDLGLITGPTKATFSHRHNIHHTGFVPVSSNSFHCGGVTARQAGICCPPFPNLSRKQRRDRDGGFFCTNYLMCDLGAWLPVMPSLWFILSFNLSSNLFATAERVSQQ